MERYNPQKIEIKWQKLWLKEKIYEPDFLRAKKPFYNLMMFPYPSAEGLHVGNMYAFTGADIYGRFKRMQGYDVFEPIGLDGFGIHSENYALKIGKHPAEQAKISEKNFYRQLQMIGNGFAWQEKLETYDPEYYRWTQWVFVQMFKRGLAYRKKAPVNWCPGCMTVLADEQVLAGRCERCNTSVIKKELEQWFFKITKYAERLLKNLDKLDWSERVKIAQRNWIGKSEGSLIRFALSRRASDRNGGADSRWPDAIEVFTTRPDTLFGATYVVLAPEHPLIKDVESSIENKEEVNEYIKMAKAKTEEERIAEGREKTGVELKGVKAINPATREEIPVWAADYVLRNVGTGAIMAVPAHDQRDWEFAKKFGLPIRWAVRPQRSFEVKNDDSELKMMEQAYEGEGILINSGKFTGMESEKAKAEITKFVGGERTANYRLRDWLISRQRYWGPPIPMIFCSSCKNTVEKLKLRASSSKLSKGEIENPGWIAVPEKDLPVKLPYIKEFRPTGTDKSPLATVKKFWKVRCPKCRGWARRETDVSDTFLDSAWYYLAYLMKFGNWKLGIGSSELASLTRRWLPVDMYIGGAEHAVLHLLYVRFLAMAFYDWGFARFEEPFKKFRAHGLLIKGGAKMSKSRGNIVNPDDYIRSYGADALRMYLMFLGPFEQGGDFQDTGIRGITRFLERTWRFVQNFKAEIQDPKQASNLNSPISTTTERILHKTIKKVTEDIENLQYNTAISALMALLNKFEENPEAVSAEHLKLFLKLLAPFAPHISEELFSRLSTAPNAERRRKNIRTNPRGSPRKAAFRSIHLESWPKYDAELVKEETFELIIQVNGKVRGRITLPMGTGPKETEELALQEKTVRKYIVDKPRKVIFVPYKLINFVV